MRRFSFDISLVAVAGLLILVGLLVLYGFGAGAKPAYFSSIFTRQLIFAFVGLAAGFGISRLDYRIFRLFGTKLYFLMIVVLGFLVVTASAVRGTAGWFDFGIVSFQPVEMAKIVLIIFLASFVVQKKSRLNEMSRLLVSFVLSGVFISLVLLQPDFGSAMVLLSIWFGMMVLSGMRRKYFFLIVFIGLFVGVSSWFLLEPYQKARVISVLYPEVDAKGSGYNAIQAMVSIGSSGFFGKGIGQGTQSKLNFLPEKHTDFIFASMTESLGLFGAFFTLFLFGFLLYRIYRVALTSSDNFGYLVASGFFIFFFVHIAVNVGMNMGVLPITGIPLPFMSYGGSSLVFSCIAIGILVNISSRGNAFRVGGRQENFD